jgi:hypothetical protein
MNGAVPPLIHTISWRAQGQIYSYHSLYGGKFYHVQETQAQLWHVCCQGINLFISQRSYHDTRNRAPSWRPKISKSWKSGKGETTARKRAKVPYKKKKENKNYQFNCYICSSYPSRLPPNFTQWCHRTPSNGALSLQKCDFMSIYTSKTLPLQAWTGPEGSRKLRLPDFKTINTWRW